MFVPFIPHRVQMISREKLEGGGRHFGVLLWDGSVLHLTLTGVEHTTLEDFGQERQVRADYAPSEDKLVEVMARVQESLASPQQYRFLIWNCEHFANWLVGLPAKSAQVDGAMAIAVGAVLIKLLAK